jgi:hypothetical protein
LSVSSAGSGGFDVWGEEVVGGAGFCGSVGGTGFDSSAAKAPEPQKTIITVA